MIGQSQVTEPLMTALRTGRIGHAYLFSGPRGCGKTTSARILARCLNCAEGPTDTPCGECASCRELSRDGGGSLDVVEIDAASHGGVDDARDLRERAVFAPARDRFKIFIIDEAHMVTPGGFNALLKIVEEPPPHVKFVFATTEPDKVIGTIRSRTHHYPFRLIAPGTLIDYVQSLCDSESVRVEPGVLPLVVRAGGGSVRDTLSILDQLIAGSEGDLVTAERAAGLLGFTHAELLDDVVAALGAHDSAAAFRATDRVVQTGQDPRRFVEDLLERLRDLIVVSATTVEGAAAVFRGVPQDQLTRMFEQAQSFGPGELSRIADVVSGSLDKMAGATAPRLQLELMIARALVEQVAQPAVAAARPQRTAAAPAASPVSAAPAAQRAEAAPGQAFPPAAPTPPRPDPLAAVAAARGALNDSPAAGAAPAQAPANSSPAASRSARADAQPNAAETAASIREFLREDPAGAGAAPKAPSTGATDSGAAPVEGPSDTAGTGPSATHPNTGAAGFGRPISDVLSAAQIEGIGRDAAFQAPPAAQQSAADSEAAAQLGSSERASGQNDGAASTAPVAADGGVAVASAGGSEPTAEGSQHDGSEVEAEAASGGFDDLVELWPELLEEILQADRDAWNAVRVVTPMALDGEVLTVGLGSQSDLAAFKTSGAGPLRETINAAIGINVKYVPKRIAPGGESREAAPQGGSGQGEAQRDPDAEEPHRAGASDQPSAPRATAPAASSAPSEAPAGGFDPGDADDPVARAAARLSGLGPALAAPAWAEPPPAPPADGAPLAPAAPRPARPEQPAASEAGVRRGPDVETAGGAAGAAPGPDSTPGGSARERVASGGDDSNSADDDYIPASYDPDGDPYAGMPDDPYGSEGPGPERDQVDQARETAATAATPDPATASAQAAGDPPAAPSSEPPAAPDPSTRRSAPAFTRYGEAVVREVLGARFVEERPLPPRTP